MTGEKEGSPHEGDTKEERARALNKEIEDGQGKVLELQATRQELRAELRQLEDVFQRRAAALGIPVAELGSQLKGLVSLEAEITAARQERDRLRGEVEALAERERELVARIERACADFGKDLLMFQATRNELVETGRLKGRLEKEIEGMEWATRVIPFLSDPDRVADRDFGLAAIVVNCLDKWLAVQPEFKYWTDPSWSRVKGYVHGKRMELRRASQGSG